MSMNACCSIPTSTSLLGQGAQVLAQHRFQLAGMPLSRPSGRPDGGSAARPTTCRRPTPAERASIPIVHSASFTRAGGLRRPVGLEGRKRFRLEA
jgi:hypothetical protein